MSRIIVGRLGAAFGIKGWQKCQSFTQPATNLFDYQPWQINIKGDWIVTEYEAYKSHGDGFVVKVPQADEREAARVASRTWRCAGCHAGRRDAQF